MTNEEKTEKTGTLDGEAKAFSKELADDDLEQVVGGDSPLPGEFAIIPNPSIGFIRVVNAAPGFIRILSLTGTLVKQVITAGGEVIIPMDGHGGGTYLVQNNGIGRKCLFK
jgi:hypothetical protein